MAKKTNGAVDAPRAGGSKISVVKQNGAKPGRQSPPRPPPARTLGPVSDLERHLPSEWWRTLFNSLYLETDGDIVENDRNTEQDVELLIRSAGLERNDRI